MGMSKIRCINEDADKPATLLGFLLLVQLGIPEMWLYNNVPAFGPQSTALWLGVAQVM
jgi:hypothetical protein